MNDLLFSEMLSYHVPHINGREKNYISEAIQSGKLNGSGLFATKCEEWLKSFTKAESILLTSSCTHALEMTALLLDVQQGDEVIMPSFNFVSAANAFALRGARIVFVDICPHTLNIDPDAVSAAISNRTKGIVLVHYAGVGCDMNRIIEIARKNNLWVVEDAAHCIGAFQDGQHLGTYGDFGVLSFHATKNIHCGEGGALIINRKDSIKDAISIREKGTNRDDFIEGKASAYEWMRLGSSYIMSELNAAFLYAQLPDIELVKETRLKVWNRYYDLLSDVDEISLLEIADNNDHNAHIFPILCRSEIERKELQDHLYNQGVHTYFHYQPLHLSPAGKLYGCFPEKDRFTSNCSKRLLRLPLTLGDDWSNLCYKVVENIRHFYK